MTRRTSQAACRLRRRRKRGFALIEVLVSLAVLSIGLVSVLTAILSTLNLQKESARRYRAGLILQEKLAEVTATPYRGAPAFGASPDSVFTWSISGAPWARPADLTITPQRGAEPDTVVNLVYEVQVDVRWQTNKGERGIHATQLVRAFPGTGVAP